MGRRSNRSSRRLASRSSSVGSSRSGTSPTSSHASTPGARVRPAGSSTRDPRPRTARPGVHHVEARTFKDVFPRFRTMTGHQVPRKAGLGLPRAAGRAGGREGDRHHGQARHRGVRGRRVQPALPRLGQRYVDECERITERIGFWIDLDDAYWTMSPALRRDRLVVAEVAARARPAARGRQGHRVLPAMRHRAVRRRGRAWATRQSRTQRVPAVPDHGGATIADLVDASLLVWTTTPWTLPSNPGVAVAPTADYVVIARDGERLIVGARCGRPSSATAGERVRTTRRARRSSAPGTSRPTRTSSDAHRVVAADFVSMDDGTGIVHLAPAFGARDLAVGLRAGLAGAQAGRRRRTLHRPRAGVRARACS